MLYLDTSALAKLYIIEPEGLGIQAILKTNEPWLFTSIVTYAETLATRARSMREERIARQSYQRQKKAFLSDWNALHVVALTPAVLSSAEQLTDRHGLRGFDAIHLCSALWIGRPSFACFDERLRRAAAGEGLTVIP